MTSRHAERRDTLQRSIYCALKDNPAVVERLLYTDAFMVAGVAADAVLDLEDDRLRQAADTTSSSRGA